MPTLSSPKQPLYSRAAVEAALHFAAERVAAQATESPVQSGPQTPEALHAWLTSITGHHIPTRAACPDHDAPFDFIADFFFETETDGIVLANRGGGKTEDVACLHLANARWKPGYATYHFGAIETQASRCYAYYRKGLRTPELRDYAPDPHIRETLWSNGSTIEIRPATEAQTQGPHGPLATFDEVEQGKYQPWENSKAVPVAWTDGSGRRHSAQFLATSTRQSGMGLMQRALDEAEEFGWKTYSWCIIETIDGKTCEDENGPLCEGCPLYANGCEGRALDANGWQSRDEVIGYFNRVGPETWWAQYLCRQPNAKALIYSNFSAANVTEEAEYVQDGGPIYLGYDWGFTDPTMCGLLQYRDGRFYQFEEIGGSGRSEREWVRAVVARVIALPGYEGPTLAEWDDVWAGRKEWPKPWPSVWIDIAAGDPSAVQFRHELKEHGIGARSAGAVRHEVEAGQDVLRAAICTAGDNRRLLVHPRCVSTIKAMQNYRARELADGSFDPRPDPDPSNHAYSHPLDMLRYLFWPIRKALGLAQDGGDDDGGT